MSDKNPERDSERLDAIIDHGWRVEFDVEEGAWVVCESDDPEPLGVGSTPREAIDRAMEQRGIA